MQSEKTPSRLGLYRFVGYRVVNLRGDRLVTDEVLLVERIRTVGGAGELVVRFFGKQRAYQVERFYGKWFYIGDEVERITQEEE